ncbi:double-stranded RNA-binding protein 4-like [Mercurialis annua]|uniref:double-stranded RNA-binding protein 4-like n=1 Tax=Mercurialis annua TaxID=3986 RepID=UPI00215E38A3|nr:double-stranded RNA-binding protein 4-like [Mercurialis annua]
MAEDLMYKNRLQEYTQKLNLALPSYHTVNEGFQHAPKFKATVLVDGQTYESNSVFPQLKQAEQDAAKSALHTIKGKTKDQWRFDINKDPKWCKSILQEYATKMMLRTPKYTTVQKEKMRPVFFSRLLFDGKTYSGEVCASKKDAEQFVARVAIQSLVGTDSGVLREIVNSKSKVYKNAVHKIRRPSKLEAKQLIR